MEIKTTEQIRQPLDNNKDFPLAELYWKKRWVSLSDMLARLKNLNKDEELEELISELEKR